LLLWTPVHLRVKQHLFNKPILDPLRDPDAEFSSCVSGIGQKSMQELQYDMQQSSDNLFDLFPKPNVPGLSIHTDTFVSLLINKGFVSICSSSEFSDFPVIGHSIFSAILTNFELQTSVGLERNPEICLLSLSVRDGTVSYGKTSSRYNFKIKT